jgi:hypothetical protein
LLAQPRREQRHGPVGVVLRAVEAMIDRTLDPAPQRLEQRDHGEGGDRDRHAVSTDDRGEEELEHRTATYTLRAASPTRSRRRVRRMGTSMSYSR